jgi:hypothetical protein
MQKHITEMALILWNISREKEKERTVNKPRRKRGRVMNTIQLITEISVLKKKMDKAEAFLEELVEYLLVTCKDDDYITPEVICRKLAKYGYIELENGYWVNPLPDRKTENSSEIPNNCEYAKNPSGDVWECGCFLDTYCEHQIYDRNPDGTINIVECGYEPKDEPQTEREGE